MALNEFNISGNFVDIDDDGVRIWQSPNDYHDAALIKHEDFAFICRQVEGYKKENKEKRNIMNSPLEGKTNNPSPERVQGIPEVDMPDCWKGFFKAKEDNQCGVTIDVRAPTVIYCTDIAQSN